MKLTRKMREPRKSRPIGASRASWYYVSPTWVEVYTEHKNATVTVARLTKRQLQLALKIME